MEIKELCKKLRYLAKEFLVSPGICREAADQIEAQQKEIETLITAINQIAEGGHTWMCPYCKNAERIYSGMCDCSLGFGVCQKNFSKFEWRKGPRLEDSYYD